MIIKNTDLIGRKRKFLILIVSMAIDIGIIVYVISTIFISIVPSTLEGHNIMLLILFAFLSTISIIDIIKILCHKKSLAFLIVQKILYNTDSGQSFQTTLNSTQKSFCETIYGMENKNSYVYVYGKHNRGKTTAVLHLLDGFSKNSKDLAEIPWIDNVTFIDCNSEKNKILDYFLMNDNSNTRVNQFSKSLTVIDNIEQLGSAFFEENVGLFSSYKSFFIIIEDTKDDFSMAKLDSYNRALLICNFNSSVIGIKPINNLFEQLKSLKSIDREVFFSLYFLTLSDEFVSIDEIERIIDINTISLHRSLNKIIKLNVYIPFPFNKKYYYCLNRNFINKLGSAISQFKEYQKILATFIKSSTTNPECRWLCYIRSDERTILSLTYNQKIKLFQKALYNGKYSELYSELNNCIEQNSYKENLFLYEKGFLSFYLGHHKIATQIFSNLIDQFDSKSKRKEMMLHIIESSHGNPDVDNMKFINNFINEIQADNDFYSVCAFYWKKHIDTEKGNFEYSAFESIRNNLMAFVRFGNNPLYKSIMHRSFLDQIRCCHILGIQPSNDFFTEYVSFLETCSPIRNEYYSNLYIQANTIHYVYLIDMLLSDSFSYEEIVSEVQKAEIYYNRALNSSYCDEKSKHATKVKLLDLCMLYHDFDYQNTVNQINIFRMHSQINDVQVHEAFCETLLVKAKILNPANISSNLGLDFNEKIIQDIYGHCKKAYEIYEKYGNAYGLIRIEFLMILFDILITSYSDDVYIEKLSSFKKRITKYPKETSIIENLLNKYKNHSISLGIILSIIRAYPIILQ